MLFANELLNLVNCTIRFTFNKKEYEGVLESVYPDAEIINLRKVIMLPDRQTSIFRFAFSDVSNIRVIYRPNDVEEKSTEKNAVFPVYSKTDVEKLLDFDEGSDIEDGVDDHQEAYKIKLVPHLSKFVPCDFEIIDSFNEDFISAIKHIIQQDTIGVSLEGIKISRSGTLTWLCVSTKSCNFLFDILSLGEDAFKEGLKSILEKSSIQKIFHDCRLASDCLYHKYGVRLVNVFDTQVADFIVMMQMIQKERIDTRVNTLDACLNYYLEVPHNYLYGDANFDSNEDSLNFHALRPLHHDIQDVLIKNVMYLHMLKRELEVALMIPLRRATDVYLNCVQKLKESELLVVPHEPGELPLDMHLDGIQIFRYKDFDNACNTVASGPPYREINNPAVSYANYCSEYEKRQKKDKVSAVKKDAFQNAKVTSKTNYTTSVNCQRASVNSLVGSSESELDCSDNTKENRIPSLHGPVKPKFKSNLSSKVENDSNMSTSNVKPEMPKLIECSSVKYPMMRGLVELLSRTANKNVKADSNESSQVAEYKPQVSKEHSNVDNKAMLSDLSNVNDLSNSKFASNLPISNSNATNTETLQLRCARPSLGRKSPSELLELISKMKSSNSFKSDSSDEKSANGSISTSESVCKKESKEIERVNNVQPARINDSVVKTDVNVSDSDLRDVAARVRARGVRLRNQKTERSATDCVSTSDAFNSNVAFKPFRETNKISSEIVKSTSEDVTVFYSDTLDKPSQFVVKINPRSSHVTNHKNVRLVDLYKKAGDGYLLGMEEDSENVPPSSPNKPSESTNDEHFWDTLLGDLRREPVDEKLRSRLVPAGMSGF